MRPRIGEPWQQKWVKDDWKNVVDFFVKPDGTAFPTRNVAAVRELGIRPEQYKYLGRANVVYRRGMVFRSEYEYIPRGW